MGRGKGFLQVIEKEVGLETGRRTRLPWYLIAPRNFCILSIESKNEEESVAGVGHTGKMMWLLRAQTREWLDHGVQEGHGKCHAHGTEEMEVPEN